MPDVGYFLEELEAEVGKGLSRLQAQTLTAEARDHLEASIQARLELGMGQEEAEAEAIAAFGAARAVGKETRRREPWIDRRLLLTSFAILAFWAASTGSTPIWAFVPIMAAFWGLHTLFIVNSARTRRFQAATLAVVLLPLWFAWSAKGAMDHIWVADEWGNWRIERADALRRANQERELGDGLVQGANSLQEGYARFKRGEISVSPARNVSLGEDGQPRLFPRTDRALADAYWRGALKRFSVVSAEKSRARFYEGAASIEAALRGPWWLGLHHEAAYFFSASGWAVGSAYLGLHAFGWVLGVALRRRRRGKPYVAA